MRGLDGVVNSMCMSLNKLWEIVRTGSLACCSPWGPKESDTTWPLNKNKLWAAGLSYKPGPESKVRFGVMHSLKMPSH